MTPENSFNTRHSEVGCRIVSFPIAQGMFFTWCHERQRKRKQSNEILFKNCKLHLIIKEYLKMSKKLILSGFWTQEGGDRIRQRRLPTSLLDLSNPLFCPPSPLPPSTQECLPHVLPPPLPCPRAFQHLLRLHQHPGLQLQCWWGGTGLPTRYPGGANLPYGMFVTSTAGSVLAAPAARQCRIRLPVWNPMRMYIGINLTGTMGLTSE